MSDFREIIGGLREHGLHVGGISTVMKPEEPYRIAGTFIVAPPKASEIRDNPGIAQWASEQIAAFIQAAHTRDPDGG